MSTPSAKTWRHLDPTMSWLAEFLENQRAATFVPDAVAVRIELCDFRRSTCGCLSKPARCLAGGYPAIVTLADCQACSI